MKEPILDDDQVDAIYERAHAEWEARNKCAPNLWVAFAAALESALLEKLCGEPVAWMVLAANTGSPCEVTLHKSETEALRQDCVIPLYSIKEKHHG